jgi:hypothetical protein
MSGKTIAMVLFRLAAFAAGFALWASFALHPWQAGAPMREGWDHPSYWSVGVPLLFAAQSAFAVFAEEPPLRQPLWVLVV